MLRLVCAFLATSMLAACGGPVSEAIPKRGAVGDRLGGSVGDRLGGVFQPRQQDLPPPEPHKQALDNVPYCPVITILDGTELYRAYTRDGEGDDKEVIVQGSIADTARECIYSEDVTSVTMKIGVEGRVILGPKGAPGTYELPLRIAVIDDQKQTVFSELVKVQANIQPGQTQFEYSEVRDGITTPLANANSIFGYQIFVGFDDLSTRR